MRELLVLRGSVHHHKAASEVGDVAIYWVDAHLVFCVGGDTDDLLQLQLVKLALGEA